MTVAGNNRATRLEISGSLILLAGKYPRGSGAKPPINLNWQKRLILTLIHRVVHAAGGRPHLLAHQAQ